MRARTLVLLLGFLLLGSVVSATEPIVIVEVYERVIAQIQDGRHVVVHPVERASASASPR